MILHTNVPFYNINNAQEIMLKKPTKIAKNKIVIENVIFLEVNPHKLCLRE